MSQLSACLHKLTVAQLKAICKEKNISGYSKLAKPALIQKIVDSGQDVNEELQAKVVQTTKTAKSSKKRETKIDSTSSSSPKNLTAPLSTNQIGPSVDPSSSRDDSPGPPKTYPDTSTVAQPSAPKLLRSNIPEIYSLSSIGNKTGRPDAPSRNKKVKKITPPSTAENSASTSQHIERLTFVDAAGTSSCSLRADLEAGCQPTMSASPTTNRITSQSPSVDVQKRVSSTVACSTSKRSALEVPFEPPAPKKPRLSPIVGKRFIPLKPPPHTGDALSTIGLKENISESLLKDTTLPTIRYLDFEFSARTDLRLQPISMPPPLAQRKHVPLFSLVFSCIEGQAIRNLVRTSRLFRYSIYLSAVDRLRQNFGGQRLTTELQSHRPNMTNFWPYLKLREFERNLCLEQFNRSFLGKLFGNNVPIHPHLWCSPDFENQIVIVVRFLLTVVYHSVSVGSNTPSLFPGSILDCQEIIKDEIAMISVLRPDESIDTVYVLQPTCEVVGRPILSSNATRPDEGRLALRADWSEMIETNITSSSPSKSLQDYLKWTNHEEYLHGISRLWLKRIVSEGQIGAYLKVVAQRYVLACVVANSVSGRWMSSTEMEQEFNGMPNLQTYPSPFRGKAKRPVSLFLPAHHLVESVHFMTSNNRHLHPALAIVQTPGREYFILKDNGMQVGCEEEGVTEVWMRLLGCDAAGVEVS